MTEYLAPLETLIEQFRKLPGIGRKSAVRMAFAVLDLPDETVEGFSEALLGAKRKIRHCAVCHNFSVDEICPICADSTRDTSLICVVEDAKAVLAFEKIRGFRGVYHVLGGVISPINGVTPDKLHIADLAERVKDGVREVIVATNPTVEGETTAMFISKLLKPLGVRDSRRRRYRICRRGDAQSRHRRQTGFLSANTALGRIPGAAFYFLQISPMASATASISRMVL